MHSSMSHPFKASYETSIPEDSYSKTPPHLVPRWARVAMKRGHVYHA